MRSNSENEVKRSATRHCIGNLCRSHRQQSMKDTSDRECISNKGAGLGMVDQSLSMVVECGHCVRPIMVSGGDIHKVSDLEFAIDTRQSNPHSPTQFRIIRSFRSDAILHRSPYTLPKPLRTPSIPNAKTSLLLSELRKGVPVSLTLLLLRDGIPSQGVYLNPGSFSMINSPLACFLLSLVNFHVINNVNTITRTFATMQA